MIQLLKPRVRRRGYDADTFMQECIVHQLEKDKTEDQLKLAWGNPV